MRKISHIINPVVVNETSDLYVAQPITFTTMRTAREFAVGVVDVTLLSAHFPKDRSIVPDYFKETPDLNRSILDVRTFEVKRKLPLIKDILDRAYNAVDSDYMIYTNVDIALLPHFYVTVNQLIEQGYDAFIINRRTITKANSSPDTIPLMYADVGKSHPGADCFVFKREAYKSFDLGFICVGSPYIGKAIHVNQKLNSENFKTFYNLHITFHIGNDRIWKSKTMKDYKAHNKKELDKILANVPKEKRSMVDKSLFTGKLKGIRKKIIDR